MTKAELFKAEALAAVATRIANLRRSLSYTTARALPRAQYDSIVIQGREADVTTFSQPDHPALNGQALVTVQIARHGLGGVVTFRIEKGLMFSPDAPPRDATDEELQACAGDQ